MVDWADDWADRIIAESDLELYPHSIKDHIADALRQAAADARAQAIEKSADLIERQAEQKDAA